MTVPTVVALLVFSTLVATWVRTDRIARLDADLAARASALASLCERDHDVYEMDEPSDGMLEGLAGVTVRAGDGAALLMEGDAEGRTWTGSFPIAEDGPGTGPAIVHVTLAAETDALDAELWALVRVMGLTGFFLVFAALGVAVAISRRIVGAEEMRALQTRFEQQARFTADASHELRTPLAIIRTEVDVALRKERGSAEYRAALEGVREGATRMQGVLESLLLLARADAGAGMDPQPVDLGELAREAGAAVTGPPTPMQGDPRLLSILIRNLLSNAHRHTPSGAVRVEVEADRDGPTLRVIDEGEGIPAEALPHLMERFFRVDSDRSRQAGGFGLGLSIVDMVARLHGGRVSITSTLGVGTVVTVCFPSGTLQPAG